jgi:hypothetical protein
MHRLMVKNVCVHMCERERERGGWAGVCIIKAAEICSHTWFGGGEAV